MRVSHSLCGEAVMKLESKWWPKYGEHGRPGTGTDAGKRAWVEAFWEVRDRPSRT